MKSMLVCKVLCIIMPAVRLHQEIFTAEFPNQMQLVLELDLALIVPIAPAGLGS